LIYKASVLLGVRLGDTLQRIVLFLPSTFLYF
jgi:hypothetical protein